MWSESRHQRIMKKERQIFPLSGRTVAIFVLLAMLGFAVYFSWFSIQANAVFYNNGFDLGNMWQTIWNVGHGHGFTFTMPMTGDRVDRLGTHADYLLILLAPMAWLSHNPNSLLILQAVVVAGGAWFVFRLAQRVLHQDGLAALLAVGYLLYGPLQYAVLWQFHAITLAVTFILAAAEAIMSKRRAWIFWLWFGLAIITKEQVGLILGLASGWMLWRVGRKREAWLAAGIGTLWSLVHFLVLIPLGRKEDSHFVWDFYYQSLGDSTGQQIRNLMKPAELWHRLVTQVHGQTFVGLVLPWVGVLVSPLFWVAGLAILPHWLSDLTYGQTYYHIAHVLAVPFVILGGIFGLQTLRQRVPRVSDWMWTLVVGLGILINATTTSPAHWSIKFDANMLMDDPALHAFQAQAKKIPPDTQVVQSREAGAIFRNHPDTPFLPLRIRDADYIVVFEPLVYSGQLNTHQTIYAGIVNFLDASHAFTRIVTVERGVIFRRDPTQPVPRIPDWLNVKLLFVDNPNMAVE